MDENRASWVIKASFYSRDVLLFWGTVEHLYYVLHYILKNETKKIKQNKIIEIKAQMLATSNSDNIHFHSQKK